MSKLEKKIEEAPNYVINEDGVVLNATTRGAVTVTNGSVRLIVFGMRKSFKVAELVSQYLPIIEEEIAPVVEKEQPIEEKKVVEKTIKTPKSTDKKVVKKVDNGGKKSKDFYEKVRTDFDKDPANFNIMKYSKEAGVSYGRIWSIVMLHKAKIEANKKAKKNEK